MQIMDILADSVRITAIKSGSDKNYILFEPHNLNELRITIVIDKEMVDLILYNDGTYRNSGERFYMFAQKYYKIEKTIDIQINLMLWPILNAISRDMIEEGKEYDRNR